jgi:hypothetical protein
VELLGGNRDRKPRLKPGITWTRLIVFLVVVAVLALVAEHFVAGTPPTSDCWVKEIDTGAHREGTCMEGNTRLVVVDMHGVLKLESLEARLLGIRERQTIEGPTGSKTSKGEFVTFDLAVTNRTDAPTGVTPGVFLLYLRQLFGESVEVDEDYEPRSFLAREREIPPQGTERGTVTFNVPAGQISGLHKSGNLDVVNLGSSVPALEPEALFSEPEYGVIRTYK